MNRETIHVAIAILVFAAFCGTVVALLIARRLKRFLNFRTLLILNYILVNMVSGAVHLGELAGASRGYFDILGNGNVSLLETSVWGAVVGLIAVCAASLWRIPMKETALGLPNEFHSPWLLNGETKSLWTAVIVLLPLSIYSTIQIQQYVKGLDATRIISVADGYARYSFLSGWLVWAVAFMAICLVSGRAGHNRLYVLFVSSISLVAIVASLAWSGGRSVIVVMTLPLALVLLPKMRGVRWLAVPTALASASMYITSLTEVRTGGANSQLATWLDWEWGRFSMLGFSKQYVDNHGYLGGETFLSSLLNIFLGIFRLIGIGIANPPLTSSMRVTGEQLLGSSATVYIVPGLSAELFLNFGIAGIAVGYFLLALIVGWTDNRYFQVDGPVLKMAFAYFGTLLVFRTIAADSGAIYSYMLYTGFPLLLLAVVSHRLRKKSFRSSSTDLPSVLTRE